MLSSQIIVTIRYVTKALCSVKYLVSENNEVSLSTRIRVEVSFCDIMIFVEHVWFIRTLSLNYAAQFKDRYIMRGHLIFNSGRKRHFGIFRHQIF